ncbi:MULTISPECIES: hypothetical protein [unclassified Caballeronia]|uniref:hypothetical protein n=1 Tax=unclassified Caballeronia TaxID=2646786 RepID=UPI002859DA1E|nr:MULTISPECIES: hypothetical protein [unclassified Caballeronia]MDR5750811.1 hypothetical protein [Caballeronia sp. LZ024]MDR5842156.1 hypothetical protein [Caballeronia sp. LZ031]
MKPLLRAVLVINALIFLAFGVLFLLTPWAALYSALQLVQVQPAFAGQLLGIALIGLSWLSFHAAVDGALTATAAKVSGHVEWLSGVVLLVWLLGLRTPELAAFGQIVSALTGVVLLVLGLGSVRLASAVRRRERAQAAGAVSAERAEKHAEKRAADKRDEIRTTPPVVPPAAPTTRRADPLSGEPVAGESFDVAGRPAARAPAATAIDPVTGRTIDPATGRPTGATFDPATGRTIDAVTGERAEPRIAPDPLRPDTR